MMVETQEKYTKIQRVPETNLIRIIMLGPSLQVKGGISSVEKLIIQELPFYIKINHIPTHEEGSVVRKILVFVRAIIKLFMIFLKEDINLVHVHVSQRGSAFRQVILTFLVWLCHKPVVIHAHGSEFKIFYSELNYLFKQILASVFRLSTQFIVLSESWKSFYMTNLGLTAKQVVVLPNPVKIPLHLPNRSESNQINFLFLGRIGKRKGAFDLIQAFATLCAEQKEKCHLTLAGDGDLEQLQDLIESLNLTAYITLPGWLGAEQRDLLLATSDVFILPSYNEGLPMALLEAMGWGLPVITTPVGGIPEIVNHAENGLLIKPGDIEQLSDSMACLIDNSALRICLGKNARESVIPLDVKKYSLSLLDIYQVT